MSFEQINKSPCSTKYDIFMQYDQNIQCKLTI